MAFIDFRRYFHVIFDLETKKLIREKVIRLEPRLECNGGGQS